MGQNSFCDKYTYFTLGTPYQVLNLPNLILIPVYSVLSYIFLFGKLWEVYINVYINVLVH